MKLLAPVSEPVSDELWNLYLEYNNPTEVPASYHRWCLMSAVATMLNRQVLFSLGHFTVFPNMYVMLIGSPGTRKSSAIKIAKKLLQNAGYDKFSAEKTTKEKFLLDLIGGTDSEGNPESIENILDRNIFGDDYTASDISEMYIAADEFNDFIGNGNIEFISLLGSFWDYSGVYSNRIKNGKSVKIPNPTINILGGNTPAGFSLAFPADILGQGFFSRLLLIYGEPTGKRITFPPPPSVSLTAELTEYLVRIKTDVIGMTTVHPTARALLDKIYKGWTALDDTRFESYSNRRFTHLLKLILIVTAMRLSTVILEADVIYANTILTHSEHLMPKALGEFGRGKNSALVHRVLQVLDATLVPMTLNQLLAKVSTDLTNIKELQEIVTIQAAAGRIQSVRGGTLLPIRRVMKEVDSDTVDFSLLTEEERSYTL